MKMTQRFTQDDAKGGRMLKPSRLFLCLPLLLTAGAYALPMTYTLNGVTFADTGTASGTFTYDALTRQFSNVNIVTTGASRFGATYNSVSGGFVPDSGGVLVVTVGSGSQQGLPGLSLLFSPVLTAAAGTSTLTGQEADCADAACTAPSGIMRNISAGTVNAAAPPSPKTWFLSGVKFADLATATGNFVFDASTNTFSNVNITTTSATRTGASYTTMSGGLMADGTGVLYVTSGALNQTGMPGLSMMFQTPLTAAGGSSPIVGLEGDCADTGCTTPSGTQRFLTAGMVTTVAGLTITKTHSGNFVQGQTNAQYTITVGNTAGAPPTSGLVTMTENPPSGLTVTGMSGTGWTCNTSTCTRSDALASGMSYSPITVMVTVAGNAPTNVTNSAMVSGGGAVSASTTDPTVIGPNVPLLTITKSHTGNFKKGQTGAQYTITVGNTAGAATTFGIVTMTENPPAGLTVTSMSGTGWTCNLVTCTRGDALVGGAIYSSITVTVNVSATATSPQVNQATASGGGSVTATANDSTTIDPAQPTLSVNRSALNYGIFGTFITSPQTVVVSISGGSGIAWTATASNPNITVTPGSGTGTGTFQVSVGVGIGGTVTVNATGAINSPQTVQVNVAFVTPAAPFGNFETPTNGATGVVGAIPITGWALDNIEVTHVDILREPVTGEAPGNLIFIGNAVFSADARSDVAFTFSTFPYQYRAGWGYQLLTNVLPNASGAGAPGNGTYKIHAIAFDKAGLQLDLGTKTITVTNATATKPFGTIDTPTQGGTVSGSDYVNFGWALTPQPGTIATDGSTITVVIDGVAVGHPVYNQFRNDIASLFPNYANSMGAVGFFHINTTTLANGVHTISWNVFDNLLRGEGVGSRYFNVLNTGGGSVAAAEEPIDESVAAAGVRVRDGLGVNRQPDPVTPDADGGYSVSMEEVGLIELHLGASSGNMLVQGEAQALPTGSTLKGGIFYWQPGPGYLGEYTMQFARPDGTKIPVRVNIVPKRY